MDIGEWNRAAGELAGCLYSLRADEGSPFSILDKETIRDIVLLALPPMPQAQVDYDPWLIHCANFDTTYELLDQGRRWMAMYS